VNDPARIVHAGLGTPHQRQQEQQKPSLHGQPSLRRADKGSRLAHSDVALGRHRVLGLVDAEGLRGPRNIRADGARFQAPVSGRHRRLLPITAPRGRYGEDDDALIE
jgi:hypothetical protein